MIGSIMEKTRVGGSQIANGLKTIISRVYQSKSIDPSVSDQDLSDTSAMFSQLGIDIREASGSYRNLNDILSDVQKKTETMTDSQKQAIYIQASGVRQANIFAAAVDTISKANNLATQAMNSSGEAASANAKYLESAQGKIQVFKSTLSSMWLNTIDDSSIKSIITDATNLLNIFSSISKEAGLIPTTLATILPILTQFNKFSDFKIVSLQLPKEEGDSWINWGTNMSKMFNAVKSSSTSFTETYSKLINEIQLSNSTINKTPSLFQMANAGIRAFSSSTIVATTATIALKAAEIALNAALTLGISFLITEGISALDKYINKTQTLTQANKELLSTQQSNIQGHQSNIQQLQQLATQYDDVKSRISKMQQSGLQPTIEDTTTLNKLNNQLANMFPNLINGYDSQGNAIINLKNGINGLIEAEKNAQKYDAEQIIKNGSKFKEQSEENIKNIQNQLKGGINQQEHPVLSFFENYTSLGGIIDGIRKLNDFDKVSSEEKKTLNEQLAEENKWYQQLIPFITQIDNNYSKLDSTLQQNISTWAKNNSEFSKMDVSGIEKKVESITKSLNKTNAKPIVEQIEELNNTAQDGMVSITNYSDNINKLLNQLSKLTGIPKNQLQKIFDIDTSKLPETIADVDNLAQSVDTLQSSLSTNLEQIEKYEKILNDIKNKGKLSSDDVTTILKKDPELIPYMNDLSELTTVISGKIDNLKDKSSELFVNMNIMEQKSNLEELVNSYNNLSKVQNLDESQKEQLTNIAEQLKNQVQGLIITKNSDDKATISNLSLATDKIKSLELESKYIALVQKYGKEKTDSMIKNEILETQTKISQAENRIKTDQAEITSLQKTIEARGLISELLIKLSGKDEEKSKVSEYKNDIANTQKNIDNLKKSLSDLTNLQGISSQADADISKSKETLNGITNTLTESTDTNTKSTKENTAAQKALAATIKAVENEMKSYENQIKSVDNALYSLDSQMQGMDETSDDYINALKEENNMYEQRVGLVKDVIDANGKYIDSIANMGGVSGTALGKEIVQKAEDYLNTPYEWGGESPEGFDCSGLVQYVYKQFGIEIGRTTYDQIDEGVAIPKQDLQPGDLVFFGDSAGSPHHVGIYAGGDEFIESPHTGASVRISNLDNRSDYVGARRVISAQDTGDVIETSSSENSTYSGKYSSYINSAASKYGIPAALIAAVIENESGWTNPSANSAGAIGIMQVTKGSAEDSGYGNANLQDIQTNIMAGSAELARDLQAFDGNLTEAIAAYNAGIGAVQKYGGIPPYSETQNYVPKVLQSYQEYGGSDTVNLSDTATSKIEDILSKNQDYTKQNIDYQRKILENNTKIYEAYMNRYEKELSTNESQLNLDKERYSLYEEGNTKLNDSSRQYMQKEWQDINERYGILIEKQKFIEGELKNNIYDEKTVAQMKQDLQDIQLEETKTVNNLHTAFKDWLADRLTYNTQGYQDNIDMLNAQLDLVNEIDEASNYSSKASYNQQILEQQLKINDALKNQIDFVQKLYDKEQSGNTRLLWSEQLEDLNKQLVESQTNIEKAKKAMEDSVISGILDSVDKKLRLINDDLKDIQSATKDISDSNTSQKLVDNMNILQDQMTILIEDTNAYAELYSQVSADGVITSDEQSKLDSQSDKIRTDKENIQSSVEAINSLNLSNIIQPFENILSSLANNTNALKLQLDMLSSSSTDYATKAGLINEELNNNNLNMENLVSEYNELMDQTATPGTKEADDLTKALETVRDKIGEAAKEGISLKNSLNDVKLSALFNQIQTPQNNINQMLSNMDFVTSMSKAGQTNGLLIGGNYQDTTKNYEDQTLENEQETLDIIDDINGKIEDLQSTTYDIDTSDLQDAVTEKIDTTNEILENIQDGITNINDNNSKTVETKNVYGTDYDLQYFKEIASKLGMSGLFNYVNTNKSEYLDNRDKYKIGSNDIVLGGTGAIGGISDADTAATRLGGVDRSGTQNQIESYLKSLLDVLSNNSGNSSNVDTEKTNQELINTLNTGNTTTSVIATNTANDVNAVQAQTTTIISTDNANVANEIATITEQGQNITEGLSTVDTSIGISNTNIESLRTSVTTVLNSILEKLNTLETETSLQELINLHGSVNNIGRLIADVNSSAESSYKFNPVAAVSVKKDKEDVNKKASGGTTEGWSIVGDGEGNNAGYELAILPDGRIIPVGQDGWELNKYPEGTQIIKHEDAVKLTGMKDISKYAEGTYKLYAQRADTNAEGLLGDYQYARQLLQTLGRTDIQLINADNGLGNKVLGDNDYIMGGSAVIASPEGFDESHRIWGATRKETESALQSFLSSHPMVATSSDINSSGSSNNATTPTSTSTSDYNKSTGSTGTGSSGSSNVGVISEDTDVRKKIKTNISNIQSNYNDQLQSGSSTSDLLQDQISLEQQSILLNNDALRQLKQQEETYAGFPDDLKKIADEESNLNKEIQDSQKKIAELAKSQVEQITAINDAKKEQYEINIKLQGSTSTKDDLVNIQRQFEVIKDINKELENYQDSLDKINKAINDETTALNVFNSSNLTGSENSQLNSLLKQQSQNGYLSESDSSKLNNLEAKLSDEDKTTLQAISSTLTELYNKKEEVEINITTTQDTIDSQMYDVAQQIVNKQKDTDQALLEQQEKSWQKEYFGISEDEWNTYHNNKISDLQDELKEAQSLAELNQGNAYYQDEVTAKQNELANTTAESYANITDWEEEYTKVHQYNIEQLEKENEEQEEKEASLKRQNDLLLLQKQLNDALNNKSVQIMTKDKEGNWQYSYVADQEKVDELQQQIGEKMQDNADADRQQKINDEKEYEQDLINVQKEAYDEMVKQAEYAFNERYKDINYLTEQLLNNIKSQFDNSDDIFAGLYSTLSEVTLQYKQTMDEIAESTAELQKKLTDLKNQTTENTSTAEDKRTQQKALRNYINSDAVDELVDEWVNGASTDQIQEKARELAKQYGVSDETYDEYMKNPQAVNDLLRSDSDTSIVSGYYSETNPVSLDTGGFTGDWGTSDGKMAILHEKELVLNQNETNDILKAMNVLDSISISDFSPNNLLASNYMNNVPINNNTSTASSVENHYHIDSIDLPNIKDVNDFVNTFETGEFTNIMKQKSSLINSKMKI